MSKLYNNGIITTAGFQYNADSPLDDRLVVETYNDLSSLNKYEGMSVYVKEKDKFYKYSNNTWTVFGGVGETTSEGGEVFNLYEDTTESLGTIAGIEFGSQTLPANTADKYAHAEGLSTAATGRGSHAEGVGTKAEGEGSHAEGAGTLVTGAGSHGEGRGVNFKVKVKSSGDNHMVITADENSLPPFTGITGAIQKATFIATQLESIKKNAIVWCETNAENHTGKFYYITDVEYQKSLLSTDSCKLLLNTTPTVSDNSVVTIIMGGALSYISHTEGNYNNTVDIESTNLYGDDDASHQRQHAEGSRTLALGYAAHSEGEYTIAEGDMSHAQGKNTTAKGGSSFAGGDSTLAEGYGSTALGYGTTASGQNSVTLGYKTEASGAQSIAEGQSTKATNNNAHAEGYNTIAEGEHSHAEGWGAIARGQAAHAEGSSTEAVGYVAHAEGGSALASGNYSHAEGKETTASGNQAHAEGNATAASSYCAHAEGNTTTADGEASHTEGYSTNATGYAAHAEGGYTIASEQYTHAEGRKTTASGQHAHSEGNETIASAGNTHAEGYKSKATKYCAHAEGEETEASGSRAHAEGYKSIASAEDSHAEGKETQAINQRAHAEGNKTIANGKDSHAEGYGTTSSGENSHAEGSETVSSGKNSHAGGSATIASAHSQTAIGKYNAEDSEALFIVGNGTNKDNRNNAFVVKNNGKIHAGVQTSDDDNSLVLATKGYLDDKLQRIEDIYNDSKLSYLTYRVSGNNAIITDCDESAGDIVIIPSVINDYIVTDVEFRNFSNRSNISTLIISEGTCSSFNESEFYGYTNLTTIYIPKSVTFIKEYSFENCQLRNVYYGGSESEWEALTSYEAQNGGYGTSMPLGLNDAIIHYNAPYTAILTPKFLVSGQHVKTVNGQSILGSGDIKVASVGDVSNLRNNIEGIRYAFNQLVSTGLFRLVVDTLPNIDEAQDNIIYMIPSEDGKDNNVYEEYMFINSTFELIGSTEVDLTNKQDILVSGTNIKTVNGESILGSGDIEIKTDQTYSSESENAQSGKAVAQAVEPVLNQVNQLDNVLRDILTAIQTGNSALETVDAIEQTIVNYLENKTVAEVE